MEIGPESQMPREIDPDSPRGLRKITQTDVTSPVTYRSRGGKRSGAGVPAADVHAPTLEQLRRYTRRSSFARAELESLSDALAGVFSFVTRVEELDALEPANSYNDRDPGRPPEPGEDPLNAFIRLCEIRGATVGPLAGRTVGIKDCIWVAGVPLTDGGCRAPEMVPTEDAVVVTRLLDAGAVITGKTNMDDLAMGIGEGSAYGPSCNPVNPRFATGGSSSGSAAAVAAGYVDMALGADQAGSVRIPAAWCGIVGMKATHGLVPSYGMTYADHTLDHIGPMTRSVSDNALMLEVIAGADWRDPQWVRREPVAERYTAALGEGVRGLRIGIVEQSIEPVGATPDVQAAFESAVQRLAEAGATIAPAVSIPLWTDAVAIHMTSLNLAVSLMLHSHGIGSGHLGRVNPAAVAGWAERARHAESAPTALKLALIATEDILERYDGVPFAKAQNLRLKLRQQVNRALVDVDVLLTPTTPHVAFARDGSDVVGDASEDRLGGDISAVRNTVPLNLTGHPALSVPYGTGYHGLPVGVQVIGRYFAEEFCYRVASALEQATGA
jgi:amidase